MTHAQGKTLLALLAHPDDESFGPGGTFARYAAEGAAVHICIATDGAAGSVAPGQEKARDNLVAVRAGELARAVAHLGATLHRLDYRDSGMRGDPANAHPDAWINARDEEAIGRVVQLIRSVRPTVVVTHDETGGYFHPDHIRCCEVVTAAFHQAADPAAYADQGLPPHRAERLYYTAFSRRWLWVFVLAVRLRGQDPKRVGNNKDIDLTQLGIDPRRLHAHIDYGRWYEQKWRASAEHASQGGGRGGGLGWLPAPLRRRLFATDTFIRAWPPVADGFRETTLFPA